MFVFAGLPFWHSEGELKKNLHMSTTEPKGWRILSPQIFKSLCFCMAQFRHYPALRVWNHLCTFYSAHSHHLITVQPRGGRAKWMSACLCDDGWASPERWRMTGVAMFIWRVTGLVTMAIMLLQWPVLDLSQKETSAITGCLHGWQIWLSCPKKKTTGYMRRKIFGKSSKCVVSC